MVKKILSVEERLIRSRVAMEREKAKKQAYIRRFDPRLQELPYRILNQFCSYYDCGINDHVMLSYDQVMDKIAHGRHWNHPNIGTTSILIIEEFYSRHENI